MSTIPAPSLLQRSLLVDALASGAFGLALVAGAGLAAAPLGLPEALLRGAGAVLLPFAALVLWLARLPVPPPPAVQALIAGNLAWVAASLLLLASGWVRPTPLGQLLVVAQALLVAGFAVAQAMGLRSRPARAAQPAAH